LERERGLVSRSISTVPDRHMARYADGHPFIRILANVDPQDLGRS
jgi:hypothetical protein